MDSFLSSAERVEAYRVRAGEADSGPFAHLVVLQQSPDLTPVEVVRLTRLLVDPASFVRRASGEEFVSGVVFRYIRGTEIGDVALCFESGEIDFTHRADIDAYTLESGSGLLTSAAFTEVARLARTLFPHDSELEALHLV